MKREVAQKEGKNGLVAIVLVAADSGHFWVSKRAEEHWVETQAT